MVKMYNEFYDLDVVKRTKDLIDLPQGTIVKKFNILYGNDISDLTEGSVVMVTDIKLKNGPKYGVQAYNGASVTLDDVSITGFKYGAVLVVD